MKPKKSFKLDWILKCYMNWVTHSKIGNFARKCKRHWSSIATIKEEYDWKIKNFYALRLMSFQVLKMLRIVKMRTWRGNFPENLWPSLYFLSTKRSFRMLFMNFSLNISYATIALEFGLGKCLSNIATFVCIFKLFTII